MDVSTINTVGDVASGIAEDLRKLGFVVDEITHPNDPEGTILGCQGGGLRFSVVVEPTS